MADAAFVLSAVLLVAVAMLAAYLIKAVSKLDTAGRKTEAEGNADPSSVNSKTLTYHTREEGFGTAVDLDLFGKIRPTMTVKLPVTGEILHIKMPTKRIADGLAEIGQLMEALSKGRADDGSINRLYSLTGVVLSNNQEAKQFYNLHDIKKLLSADDCADVLTQYLQFMTAQLDSKN